MDPTGWVRTMALAVSLSGLAGCAVVDAMKEDLAKGFPEAKPPARESAVPPPGPNAPAPAAGTPAARKTPAAKPLAPNLLVGLTQEEARGLLGSPSAEHSDPPATVWTWRNKKCQIDLFFYMDLSDRKFRALTYEIHGARNRESVCLGELREESQSGRRGG